ncbi:MAG: winged helix-turn-helix domain-containing protein [archaeon]|nr:winged helix-turn-helix domain-containing protein [archaeon]MCR4323829.1 winged helix-turn-helix domain-containing protein [Nanoarchaeota archaeon]
MDLIKEAFLKIKEEIKSLKEEINLLREGLLELHTLQTNKGSPTAEKRTPTDKQTNTSQNVPLEVSYNPNLQSSIGNRGVPTDRQTDRQTDRHNEIPFENPIISDFRKANEVLASLDSLKRGIRIKFKKLTSQEMVVFSEIYLLEDQNNTQITYKLLSERLNLSESSVRDYINKLIKKGVPIDKIKQNNKTIFLKISQDLKNITNLDTITHLREI